VENAGLENGGPKFTRWHLQGRKMEDRKMQDWKMEDLDNKRTFKNAWPCNNAHAVKGRVFKKCLWWLRKLTCKLHHAWISLV